MKKTAFGAQARRDTPRDVALCLPICHAMRVISAGAGTAEAASAGAQGGRLP